MSQRESQLRAVVLITIVVVATTFVGSVLFLGNKTTGLLGTVATFLFGLFGVYHHYFELPEGVSDTVHEVEIDDTATAGARPKAGEEGFDIDVDDVVLSQLPPKRVAQVICNSPCWHSDGHGGYATWWRPRLRRLFYADIFSNKAFEMVLFGLTIGGYVLLYFIFLSFYPDNLGGMFFEPLTEVYPSSQPIEVTHLLIFASIAISLIGTAYFGIKSSSTCSVCHSPFSLESKMRYFKPENRKVITTTEEGVSKEIEVTYGVHIFHCESCDSWSVITKRWKKDL